MQLLACQTRIPVTRSREAQMAWLHCLGERLKKACGESPPDLVVLPELSSLEYGEAAFSRLGTLDDDLQGPVFTHFAALAQSVGTTIAYGTARRSVEGRHHISQVIVGPDGRLTGVYDKLHCAQFGASAEAPWFTPGDRLLITEIAGWRVGVMICYDLRFPELAGRLAREGVELILHPVAFTRDFSFASWHAFVTTRAMENQLYWLSLNRAGPDWGDSLLCPPLVDDEHPPQAFGRAEAWPRLTLSKEILRAARARLPLAQDRRGDLAELPLWQPD